MKIHTHLSEVKRKLIGSLSYAKYRKKEQLFVAEGNKLLEEMLATHVCALLVGTREYVENLLSRFSSHVEEVVIVEDDFKFLSISSLQTPRPILGILRMPDYFPNLQPTKPLIFLDGIQDPGNVGSILRTCNWFGIEEVWATNDTADFYAPRVVQATMGALAHLRVLRSESAYEWVREVVAKNPNCSVVGAFLDGIPIKDFSIVSPYILAVGNEGNGISATLSKFISHRITIPPVGATGNHCESLNVAAAAAILLAGLEQ